jgi:uncharacterized protein (TIGR04255 family)
MAETADFCPTFSSPPVMETRIGVQFAPLVGFRSGHFGLFWQECLGTEEWRILEDQPPLPKETEQFGNKRLRPVSEKQEEDDFPQVRMRLANKTAPEMVQFQANKLVYGWTRDKSPRPSYSGVKVKCERLFERLAAFAEKWNLSKPEPDLWELTYVNKILPGKLWQTPGEWHKVLPGIFPPNGPQVTEHEWSTFSGTWYFVIPPQMGRVTVRVQKVVELKTDAIALLVVITSRGAIGSQGVPDWLTGVELGHHSAVRLFFDLASPEAREEWGYKP